MLKLIGMDHVQHRTADCVGQLCALSCSLDRDVFLSFEVPLSICGSLTRWVVCRLNRRGRHRDGCDQNACDYRGPECASGSLGMRLEFLFRVSFCPRWN